ncbi:hypothetical protein Fmac_009007 [Flemingia macrophylla]|uniref:Uncharacterized protein n=1 Tax=Flemingia macrophylla TaxID=520843 RepID=A0ABD1MZ00_9FABA
MKGIPLFTDYLKTIQFDGLKGSIRDFSEVGKMLKQESCFAKARFNLMYGKI